MLFSDTGPITIAHDYFTQRGGAERVAAAMIDALQPARVVTGLYAPERSFRLRNADVLETSFLQRLRAFRRDPRRALPALPLAWLAVAPVREGLVICSSSGWSHAIRTEGAARKVVYCHNPARWLYQSEDFFRDQPWAIRLMMKVLRPLLVRWDLRAARSADVYIANSRAVADRVRAAYGLEAAVVHPPISIDPAGPQSSIESLAGPFFLTVGRGRGYKNVDKLLAAFAELPAERLVVVGSAPKHPPIPDNVTFVSGVSDAQLRWLYQNAHALLSVSHEDFGLTPLEANAFGTPALVLRAGGFLDSLDEGVSGRYIESSSVDSIVEAVQTFPSRWDRAAIRRHATRFSIAAFIAQIGEVVLPRYRDAA